MSLNLSDPLEKIKGIGPRYLKCFQRLSINTIKDLLYYYPFRYEDFSQIKKISELQNEEKVSLIGEIKKISSRRTFRKKMFLIEAELEDDTGSLKIIWFNQVYLLKTLKKGMTLSVSGKVKKQGKKFILSNPSFEILSYFKEELKDQKEILNYLKHTARLVPIYSETEGLSSKAIRSFILKVLDLRNQIKEYLPSFILEKYNLLPLNEALLKIHFPNTLEEAQKAKERFIFESLLFSQLYLLRIKLKNKLLKFPKIKLDVELLKNFTKSLPFELTHSQKRALYEIALNMEQKPMNRLLEGDVGSGKTIVAMGAALLAINSGYQVALMAPTEVLAKQHYQKFKEFLKDFKIKIGLLTSSEKRIYDNGLEGKISRKALQKILNYSFPLILIGTHALISKDIKFSKLGLVIVDEQHRFGVEQRKKLLTQTKNLEIPHLLLMSATPIPRTLALVFYGDLDLSMIEEMPQGRKPIITEVVTKKQINKVYDFIREEIKKGRQAFFICPRIEEKEPSTINEVKAKDLVSLAEKLKAEVKAVKKEYKKLKEEIFPDLRIGMLHGKMKPQEKDEIMKKFLNKEIDILVSTSVIEVGIDVENASIMVIEGADHFGLAQLHQFRGRVGRSSYQSYCFLIPENFSSSTLERLKAMIKYNNGFKLAEIDLSLRGPGEFLGTRQSGIPDLIMRSLLNKELIEKTHQLAESLLQEDPTLKKWPLLFSAFCEFIKKQKRG
ncbi:MAG: ATP-dependent DNA helicase RecG [Candidatus Paceibacterota bacterium]